MQRFSFFYIYFRIFREKFLDSLGKMAKYYRWGLSKHILLSFTNILRKGFFWKSSSKKESGKFIGKWAKTFRKFGQNLSSRLPKLLSTKPEGNSEEFFPWKQNSIKAIWRKVSNLWPESRQGCQNSIQHYQRKIEREKISRKLLLLYSFRALRGQLQIFGANSRQVVKACPEEQSE